MTLLEMICEELGVEMGDLWLGNNGFKYQIMGDGKIRKYTHDGEAICVGYDIWAEIIGGSLKPVWKPEEGETYYIPDFFHEEDNRYGFSVWDDSEFDNWCFENNMVFKTKKEAIEATNRLIELYKEDR